jgi:hypothetical protein
MSLNLFNHVNFITVLLTLPKNLSQGVGGFFKKSVFGFSDSFSKFTGSIGKGLAVATMDRKFQDRRRANMTRNRPKHAVYGVTQGVNQFGTSVASGVAGLVVMCLICICSPLVHVSDIF